MRLQSIKLSGFKSFAEFTHCMLPGQLVGVVGPNGCGKSNIMDAVRWVLGESRASELRGESMQDVIFNGTNQRKPASRASVELVFDNADQRAGGQWGQFAEIAVRRVLTRDGTSSYFINNQPVRRRDVHDVFLGTGLGPRAYAIIGQGTISRIIESKPEELRLFLEEAAGVSRYKERRRETALRLASTQDNLTRVEDIQRELTSQLDKLEQQAEVASRYQTLHASATLKQQQLWFLKCAEAEAEQAQAQQAAALAQNAFEAHTAELRQQESALETLRQTHYDAGDRVTRAQGLLYEASAELGRLEAEIRFVFDSRQRVEQRLLQLQEQQHTWHARSEQAQDTLTEVAEAVVEAEEQALLLSAQEEEQAHTVPLLQDRLRQAQAKAQTQRTEVTQIQQHIQLLAVEQRNLQDQHRQLNQRRERLQADQRGLNRPDPQRLASVQAQWASAQAELQTQEAAAQAWQDSVPLRDAERTRAQAQLNQELARQSALYARREALQALQDKVRSQGRLPDWLRQQGLDALPALWQSLQVEPGWEAALEACLRERLTALPVAALERVSAFANDGAGQNSPPARLAFYETPSPSAEQPPKPAQQFGDITDLLPLVSRVRAPDAARQALLADWLHGCLGANTLAQALALRHRLHAGACMVVRTGHVVGLHSLSFYAPDSEQAGLLARAQELEHLDKDGRAQAIVTEQARLALARTEAAYAEAVQAQRSARQSATEARSRSHALQVENLQLSQLQAQAESRQAQLARDLAELDDELKAVQARSVSAEARFEALDLQLADTQDRQTQHDDRVLQAERALQQAQQQQRSLERQAQEADFALRSLHARQAELQRTLETAASQTSALQDETRRARDELDRLNDAAAQGGLHAAQQRKQSRETELAQLRQQYESLSAQLRSADERRMQQERALEPLRSRITECQLQEQAARLGVAQYRQLLTDAQADPATLASSVVQGQVKLFGLQAEIDRLHRDIQALGAVNLAALDELVIARERKQFLDAQSADLYEALTTLQDAIRKIDAETRDLLGQTFETVNQHFGRMFPELFGGGQARLLMTGEEILDAGVQVMAQPPGKKNQTIHLLSGGEKALTAIALVFAIFQLNPAPFCLLDEVDAPLDDANTERYAQLVTRMSQQGTQFLFISHNKIAMEMAKQLIGVTMQEQGVSRIVAVDMAAATGMMEPR
ncbi:MAG: chromosome segregation protein [Pseudomonadota bacterium]